MCLEKKMVVFSILLGLVITVATLFSYNRSVVGEFPNVRFVSSPLMGMSYWGLPLPLMKQVVYPGTVKEIIWLNFVVDLLFWTAVVLVVKIFYLTVIKGEKLSAPKKTKRRKRKPKTKRRPRRTRRTRRR